MVKNVRLEKVKCEDGCGALMGIEGGRDDGGGDDVCSDNVCNDVAGESSSGGWARLEYLFIVNRFLAVRPNMLR